MTVFYFYIIKCQDFLSSEFKFHNHPDVMKTSVVSSYKKRKGRRSLMDVRNRTWGRSVMRFENEDRRTKDDN